MADGAAEAPPRETKTARGRRVLYRARRRLRRSAVDYFRGDASDWFAFGVLFLLVPLITVVTLVVPIWCPDCQRA